MTTGQKKKKAEMKQKLKMERHRRLVEGFFEGLKMCNLTNLKSGVQRLCLHFKHRELSVTQCPLMLYA